MAISSDSGGRPPCAHFAPVGEPHRKQANDATGFRYPRNLWGFQVGVSSQTREMAVKVNFDWRSAVPLMNLTVHC